MSQADLGTFDGALVLATSIKVTNAGDGLSAALAVDPTLMHLGQKVCVVLECEVADITFSPIPKAAGTVVRVHKLRAGDAAIVAEDLVSDALNEQRRRIEASKGVERLDFSGSGDDEFEATDGPDGTTVVDPDGQVVALDERRSSSK